MFQTILVPLDGTPEAERALPLARSIAQHGRATLRLVRVLPDLADIYFWAPEPGTKLETNLRQQYIDEARQYLQRVAQRLEGEGVASVICDVVAEEEDVSKAIGHDALRNKADLIVMINQGRGALRRFWLGSVADELVHSLPVPVLLVPVKAPANPGADLRQIMVALDGTAESEQMLAPALAISQAIGAELSLVHVEPENHSAAERARAVAYLEAVADRLRATGATVHTRHLVGPRVAPALMKEAHSDADVLAMETEGRHGLARLLHPSVVDEVRHDSAHPILVLRRAARKTLPV